MNCKISLAPCLKLLLLAACAYRFAYMFIRNPLSIVVSDMGRHLYNGLHLLDPGYWGSIDAKFYQVWLYLVFMLGGGPNPAVVAVMTGIISTAMPWLWYKAARELFPREKALAFALFVALCPSFFFIYTVLMPETVMLPMLGLSMWMTLRALRKQTMSAFCITAWCWVLSAHIKLSVAGMACIALSYLLCKQPAPRRVLAISMIAIALAATCIPAAWHSHKSLNVYEPFHFGMPNTIYRKSGYTGFTFQTLGYGSWIFISPSFTQNAFAPFGEYISWRTPGPYHFIIDPKKGMADWDRVLAEAGKNYTLSVRVKDWAENALFFMLSPSWPDSWEDAPFAWQRINFTTRWMWPPIILLVLFLAPFVFIPSLRAAHDCFPLLFTRSLPPSPRLRRTSLAAHDRFPLSQGVSEAKKLTLILTWVTLMALLFQQSAVMEARYRKPVEPLMLLCVIILMEDKRERAHNGRLPTGAYTLEDFC